MNQALDAPFAWRASEYAQRYFDGERRFVAAGLRQTVGPSVLQIGDHIEQQLVEELDLPFLVQTSRRTSAGSDLICNPAFLPFASDSFSTVILPHTIERDRLPHQVLREAHRVLMSEGHIVLTGFNPLSFIGAQRMVKSKAVMRGRYYSPKRVTDWLQLLGFDVVASSMFQYAPLTKSPGTQKAFQFFESVGDRWLPMFGGAYMIAAKKKEVASTLVGRVRFRARKAKLATSPSAQARVKNLKNSQEES